jgi:hypothetical protein
MKQKISLLSPIRFEFDKKKTLKLNVFTDPFYIDDECGIKTPIMIEIIEFGERPNLNIADLMNIHLAQFIYVVKSKIGYIGSSLAQNVFNKLKDVNDEFKKDQSLKNIFDKKISSFNKKRIDEFVNISSTDQDKLYKKLTFRAHFEIIKEVLEELGKNDSLNSIYEKYEMDELFKAFSKFIDDRNIYVHGILKFRASKRITLLEYENKSKEIEFAEVNKDILNSFIQCQTDICEFLNQIKDIQQSNLK